MAARRQSKAPLGSLSRNENTKDLQGSNKDSKDLIFVSFQIFIDQDTDYCQSLSTWERKGFSRKWIPLWFTVKETTANPQRIKKYGSYPEKSKLGFPECPKNLSESANWSSLRLSVKLESLVLWIGIFFM